MNNPRGGGEAEASYTITFNASWSVATHPEGFPRGPHFSSLVGATHNSSVVFWDAGGTSSDGIKSMAETGATSTLKGEVQTAIDAGNADSFVAAGGIGSSPGSISVTVTVSQSFPLLTLVSMIAPSPDWFVGVHGLSLLENDLWLNRKEVDLLAYDAGTDSGATYAAPNSATEPRESIARLEDSLFVSGGGVAPPLGTLVIVKN